MRTNLGWWLCAAALLTCANHEHSSAPVPAPTPEPDAFVETARTGDVPVPVELAVFAMDLVDAGAAVQDAGDFDAGPPDLDAGIEAADAGWTGPDAGVAAPDAGISSSDAGAAEADAGVPELDAGQALAGCLRIMPLGDSITVGKNGGYRSTLYSTLTALGCGVDLVGSLNDEFTSVADKDHEGHPGFNIEALRTSIDAWLASSQPDYVLLLIGTNDIAWWSSETASEIAQRHAALIDRIQADRPGVWIIVGTLPPIVPAIIQPLGVDRAALAADVSAAISSRINARVQAGQRVRLADIHNALEVDDLADGIHPSPAGSIKVANTWLQALLPLTSCSSHPACGF